MDDTRHEIKLATHVGLYKPAAPAFGVPLMKFEESAWERYSRKETSLDVCYEEKQAELEDLKTVAENYHAINWKRVVQNI